MISSVILGSFYTGKRWDERIDWCCSTSKRAKTCKAAPVCVLAEVFLGMSIWEAIQDRLERTFLLTGLKCHAVFLEELGERSLCVMQRKRIIHQSKLQTFSTVTDFFFMYQKNVLCM